MLCNSSFELTFSFLLVSTLTSSNENAVPSKWLEQIPEESFVYKDATVEEVVWL